MESVNLSAKYTNRGTGMYDEVKSVLDGRRHLRNKRKDIGSALEKINLIDSSDEMVRELELIERSLLEKAESKYVISNQASNIDRDGFYELAKITKEKIGYVNKILNGEMKVSVFDSGEKIEGHVYTSERLDEDVKFVGRDKGHKGRNLNVRTPGVKERHEIYDKEFNSEEVTDNGKSKIGLGWKIGIGASVLALAACTILSKSNPDVSDRDVSTYTAHSSIENSDSTLSFEEATARINSLLPQGLIDMGGIEYLDSLDSLVDVSNLPNTSEGDRFGHPWRYLGGNSDSNLFGDEDVVSVFGVASTDAKRWSRFPDVRTNSEFYDIGREAEAEESREVAVATNYEAKEKISVPEVETQIKAVKTNTTRVLPKFAPRGSANPVELSVGRTPFIDNGLDSVMEIYNNLGNHEVQDRVTGAGLGNIINPGVSGLEVAYDTPESPEKVAVKETDRKHFVRTGREIVINHESTGRQTNWRRERDRWVDVRDETPTDFVDVDNSTGQPIVTKNAHLLSPMTPNDYDKIEIVENPTLELPKVAYSSKAAETTLLGVSTGAFSEAPAVVEREETDVERAIRLSEETNRKWLEQHGSFSFRFGAGDKMGEMLRSLGTSEAVFYAAR